MIIAGPVLAAGQAARRSSIHTTAGSTRTRASPGTTSGALATSSIADRTSGHTGSPTAHCIASRRQSRRAKQTTAPIARAERTRTVGRSVPINLSTIVYDTAGVHSNVVRLARTASSSGCRLAC
jgi:hypothetical protein